MNGKKLHAEIDELQRMFQAEDLRGQRLKRWRRKLGSVFHALNVVFIIGVAVYLLAVYGRRLLVWLDLGWQ